MSNTKAFVLWRAAALGLLGTLASVSGCTCGHTPDNPASDSAVPSLDTGLPDDAASSGPVRIFTINPDNGPYTGGTLVTLIGTGFTDGAQVIIGGNLVDPLDVVVRDMNVIEAVTPPGTPGPADVVVSDSMGLDTLSGGFTYDAFYVDPNSGPASGGTFVTITGSGTSFAAGATVLFDNQPCTSVNVASAEVLTCLTPPGYTGDADVSVSTDGVASHGYTYYDSSNPNGGLAGGPIVGTVTVTVYDAGTGEPLPGAFVILGTDPTTPWQGLTDSAGHIPFSDPSLTGPISVTAAKEGYEATTIVVFDAADVSIYLVPIPDPMPGPPPPGRLAGLISGNILFGGSTGIGDPEWSLVPAPRYETEIKVALVFTTEADLYVDRVPPGTGGTVEWDATGGTAAYPYTINSRLGSLSVYALGGLLDTATDEFEAFAFGAHRAVLVGPGDVIGGIDVVVDTPLDQAITLQLDAPPPFGNPGPDEYRAEAYVDLGGEGVVRRTDALVRDPSGATTLVVPAQSGLFGDVSDGTYTVIGSAFTGEANPFSVVLVHGVTDLTSPIDVGPFLGIPSPVDPPYGGAVTDWHFEFAEDGAPPDFHVALIYALDQTPVWRLFIRGSERSFDLPDLVALGVLPSLPTGQYLVWVIWSVQIPSFDFDSFSYRDLQQRYWTAYSADAFLIQL
jgi:hypothetical protein